MLDKLLLGVVCFLWLSGTSAQTYPTKPVRIVVALAPGGGVDTSARLVAQKLSDAWKQQVVVENRPGAGGTIAAEFVARAAPDGYTVLWTSIGLAMAPSLYKLNFDPVKDFAPITVAANGPNVLAVHPSVPARSVKELIALAKAQPDALHYSSSGNGSPAHIAVETLKLSTGAKLQHVPYKGTGPGITDLLAGRVSLTIASITSILPHAQAGKLRMLGVAGARRSQTLPEVPTIAEAGVPGYAVDVWYAAFAPTGTPPAIVSRLQQEIANALAKPDVKERMFAVGLEPVGNTPAEFSAYFRSETEKWAKVIRAAGIKPD
jgi:tripartite-type tricarboxylate transporter receptor subunit TctC